MRSPGRAAALVALLVSGLGLCRCTVDEPPEAATPETDPERRRVLLFWERFNAATRVRSGGSCAEALPVYEEALALDPDHEDCLYYLGQCRRQVGEPGLARDSLERLVQLNPESARGHLALGALLASPDPAEPMDLEAAERHLRRAHEINGEETGPVVRLGEVTLVSGRPEEARQWFEAALRTNGKSVEAALLAGYTVWAAREAPDPAPLALRVRRAATVEAPVASVLNEGDRRDARGKIARPLLSPLGRLLFEEPVDVLRARGASGQPPSDAEVVEAWREVDRLLREYEARR